VPVATAVVRAEEKEGAACTEAARPASASQTRSRSCRSRTEGLRAGVRSTWVWDLSCQWRLPSELV
jgi:hypothetical protein